MARRVMVEIPATSANLGPGFDCLGLALELYNAVSLEYADDFEVEISGEGVDRLPRTEANLICRAIQTYYDALGRPVPTFRLSLENHIPLARGLGSSAAAVVGGLFAANALAGDLMSFSDLLKLAHKLEGHPDNVAPAIYGGLTVAVATGDEVMCVKCPIPEGLKAVLFIPDFAMSTRAARQVLPRFVSRADAVFNVGRAAALVAALTTSQIEYVGEATRDRLHQPYREQIFPAMPDLVAAAREAGALGAFLSGAGSTICALCSGNEDAVAGAMQMVGQEKGFPGHTQITSVARHGTRLIDNSP
ncbi:MAG: homoserine kinase [Chloroflexi bacterium]|nr:homoserine kinase [Chloroflexota bacterium]